MSDEKESDTIRHRHRGVYLGKVERMPDSFMRYKAGKIAFLLVCLFLCTACGRKEAVFEAGEPLISLEKQEEAEKPYVTEETKTEKSDPDPEEQKSERGASVSGKININTADREQLMTLPGIGETRASAIIEYRERTGAFEKAEDIMNVKGIKTGVFSKISSLICVK